MRSRSLAVALALAAIGLYAFVELVPTSGPELASTVWLVDVEGEPRLLFLTRQERTTIARLPSRVLPGGRSEDVVEYHLRMARAEDGGGRARAEVYEPRPTHHVPSLLGVAGGCVWLFTDRLEARDLRDLSLRFDADDLRAANPADAGAIADEARFYDVESGRGRVVVRGTDGASRHFRPPDLALRPLGRERSSEPEGPAPARPANELVLVRAGALAGIEYLLASDFEAAAERTRRAAGTWTLSPEYGSLSQDEPRSLYRGGDGPLTQLGDARFIRGGLLARPPERSSGAAEPTAWALEDPASLLIWSRSSLASGASWLLSRIAADGSVVFEADPGLTEARYGLVTQANAVLVGTGPPEAGYERGGARIVSIDLVTGASAVAWEDAR